MILYNMSLFKENDEALLNALRNQLDSNSESESENSVQGNEATHSKDIDSTQTEQEVNSKPDIVEFDDDDSDLEVIVDLTADPDEEYIEDKPQDNTFSSSMIAVDDEEPTAPESEEYDFTLNFRLDGTDFQRIVTSNKTPLREALKSVIEKLEAEGKGLMIYSEDIALPLDQSPESLNLRPGTILNALSSSSAHIPPNNTDDFITIKVQDGNRKHGIQSFKINPKEPISSFKQLYAKEMGLHSTQKITLLFDGDPIGDDSTPEDVELEDDCIVDVIVN